MPRFTRPRSVVPAKAPEPPPGAPRIMHCKACYVEWFGGPECWSCGKKGEYGTLGYPLASSHTVDFSKEVTE